MSGPLLDEKCSSSQPKLATAASLPPELFQTIIKHIATFTWGPLWAPDAARTRDLKLGALVCIEWATHCRRRLFANNSVIIRSLSDLQYLDSFTVNGSRRLNPIYSLVSSITVKQSWEARSWCHLPRTSLFYRAADTFGADFDSNTMVLSGPVPAHLPRAAYRSPSWSVSRSLPSYFLPFHNLTLEDIHFHALSDVFALSRCYTNLGFIRCNHLTWDETDMSFEDLYVSPRRCRIPSSTKAPCRKMVHAQTSGCSDNIIVLALVFETLFPDSETAFSFMEVDGRIACLAMFKACSFASRGVAEDTPDVTVHAQLSHACMLLFLVLLLIPVMLTMYATSIHGPKSVPRTRAGNKYRQISLN